MNAKPLTDNSKRSRSKKKKDPLDVRLDQLKTIRIDDRELSGRDLSAYADALAGAKAAQKALNVAIEEAEEVLKAAMLRQYCDHYTATGKPPDLRRSFGTTGSFSVVQQRSVKVSQERATSLAAAGIGISSYQKIGYTINLGKATKETIKRVIESLKASLGDDYQTVVSKSITLDKEFFENLLDVVRSSLGEGERLDEKMMLALRILNPTIQFKEFSTDLSSPQGFDLAYEFSKISANKEKAIARTKSSTGG